MKIQEKYFCGRCNSEMSDICGSTHYCSNPQPIMSDKDKKLTEYILKIIRGNKKINIIKLLVVY